MGLMSDVNVDLPFLGNKLPDECVKRETPSCNLEPPCSKHQKRVQLCLYGIDHFMTDR